MPAAFARSYKIEIYVLDGVRVIGGSPDKVSEN